jgi:hypothetical protein
LSEGPIGEFDLSAARAFEVNVFPFGDSDEGFDGYFFLVAGSAFDLERVSEFFEVPVAFVCGSAGPLAVGFVKVSGHVLGPRKSGADFNTVTNLNIVTHLNIASPSSSENPAL